MLSGATTPDDSIGSGSSLLKKYNSSILVIGPKNVGKSNLVARMMEAGCADFTDSCQAADFVSSELVLPILDNDCVLSATVRYEIYDSHTLNDHSVSLKEAYRKADYVVFVFDITSRASFSELNRYMTNYIVLAHRHNAFILLVGCKGDLLDRREVSTEEIMEWCSVTRTKTPISYIECSSKSGYGVTDVTSFLIDKHQELHLNRARLAKIHASSDSTAADTYSSLLDATLQRARIGSMASDDISDAPIPRTESTSDKEIKNRWAEFEQKMALSLSADRQETQSADGEADDISIDAAGQLTDFGASRASESSILSRTSIYSVNSGIGYLDPAEEGFSSESPTRLSDGVAVPRSSITSRRGSKQQNENQNATHYRQQQRQSEWEMARSVIEQSFDDIDGFFQHHNGRPKTLQRDSTATTFRTDSNLSERYSHETHFSDAPYEYNSRDKWSRDYSPRGQQTGGFEKNCVDAFLCGWWNC